MKGLLAIVQLLVDQHLSLIPIRYREKVPLTTWSGAQTRRATYDELAADIAHAWPVNIGIVTGSISGVVVVDADSPESLRFVTPRLPYTPWQTQTPKGFHLFYRHPGGPVSNRARVTTPGGRLQLDVRGDGGFVVAPPSVHPSGALYQFAGDWDVPHGEIPLFQPSWLAEPQRRESRAPITRPTGEIVTRARAYLGKIPRPEIGAGSDTATLTAACRLVRGFALPAPDATALLWEWAGGRSGWTYGWIVAKVAAAERYGTEPVGALR